MVNVAYEVFGSYQFWLLLPLLVPGALVTFDVAHSCTVRWLLDHMPQWIDKNAKAKRKDQFFSPVQARRVSHAVPNPPQRQAVAEEASNPVLGLGVAS
jgi:hypothetical protein